MHLHASLPEAVQPALFQHINQSQDTYPPLDAAAACGSNGDLAVNLMVNRPKLTVTTMNSIYSKAAFLLL